MRMIIRLLYLPIYNFKMYRYLILCLGLAIISCGRMKDVRQLQRMYGKEIDLSILSLSSQSLRGPKIIVFYGRDECSQCQLGQISDWNEIILQLDSTRLSVPIYFIIAPSEKDISKIRRMVEDLKLHHYQIKIDSTNQFIRQNVIIPSDALFHTFLLDEQNRIIVVGNPLFNDKLWNLYYSEIQRICEGV